MRQFHRVLSYFNPIFIYYTVIYFISKIVQQGLGTESFWQILWDKVRSTFGDNADVYTIWIFNIYTTVLYWTVGFALIALEKYKGSKVLDKYKIQKTKTSEIHQQDRMSKVVRDVLRNQLSLVIIAAIISMFETNHLRISLSPDVPTFFVTMRDLLVCFFCQETFFYYSHRVLHHRWFYHLHKQHHEFITPSSITAEYCGFIEHIFSNVIPVVIGFKFMGTHATTAFLWLTIVIITTLNDHAGYHLPFLHSPELHDYHHLKFNVNYSVYGFLDKLHGTYGHFEKSKSYENHRTLFSFSSVYEPQ